MSNKLKLKKVTIRDLDEETLNKVAGGDDETVFTCEYSGCTVCMSCGGTCECPTEWCPTLGCPPQTDWGQYRCTEI